MKLKTTEKGFTLVELLVALSIAAFVTAAASMTIITMMRLSPQTNNWAIALRQVQNAGYWISRDVQRAQNIHDNVAAPDFLILTWTDWGYGGDNIYHSITYKFEDMPDGVKRLMRRHQDSNGLDEQIMIAEYIDANNTSASYTSPVLTVKIAAISGEVPVSRDYEATRRPTF